MNADGMEFYATLIVFVCMNNSEEEESVGCDEIMAANPRSRPSLKMKLRYSTVIERVGTLCSCRRTDMHL